MNQNNPFGSTQSGAFQAPSNAVKPGCSNPFSGSRVPPTSRSKRRAFLGLDSDKLHLQMFLDKLLPSDKPPRHLNKLQRLGKLLSRNSKFLFLGKPRLLRPSKLLRLAKGLQHRNNRLFLGKLPLLPHSKLLQRLVSKVVLFLEAAAHQLLVRTLHRQIRVLFLDKHRLLVPLLDSLLGSGKELVARQVLLEPSKFHNLGKPLQQVQDSVLVILYSDSRHPQLQAQVVL
ncbi:hypothetical protein WMY93_031415 [Mugilogobius chulae]|uniref:Uncharacterized protein n=1 Tax=Mugilogobius chulae TaxID=88201 RepID=A0AAW0MIK3_9GOBI